MQIAPSVRLEVTAVTSIVAKLRDARTAVLTVAGFGGLTASAWATWGLGAGLGCFGASCLLVEYLSGEESKR